MTLGQKVVSAILDGNLEQPELPSGGSSSGSISPQDVAYPAIEKWKQARDRGKIVYEYSIRTHGVMASDFWQGTSTVFTRWDDVATGAGWNAYEAVNDAKDSLSEQGWDVQPITNEFDPNDADNVQNAVREANPDAETDEDGNIDTGDCYYYVVIYVRGVPKQGEE
jgi:hypothetical protein